MIKHMFYRAKAPPAKKNVGLWGRECSLSSDAWDLVPVVPVNFKSQTTLSAIVFKPAWKDMNMDRIAVVGTAFTICQLTKLHKK